MAFIVYMVFLDKNNLIETQQIVKEIEELESKADYFRNRIAEDSTTIESLKDDEYLERHAREKFLMKQKDETIIIVK